jgi:hypothetical protein
LEKSHFQEVKGKALAGCARASYFLLATSH